MKITYPKNFSSSRNKTIIDYCKWKNVLHIWACDAPYTKEKYNNQKWPLLYREIDNVCLNQLWIDLDQESIDFLNSKKEFKKSKSLYTDMNKLENLEYNPDVIIFWEVIEHLMNLEVALSNIKKVMWKDTILIISTPNCFYINNFINALFGFEYMHEDHKVFFSYWYLKNLLYFNWIEVKKWYFTFLDKDSNWNFIWRTLRLTAKFISKIFKWYWETLLIISKLK